MSDYLKKLMTPDDSRSSRAIMSRGKAVYRGGTNAPRLGPKDLKAAITRRLENQVRKPLGR